MSVHENKHLVKHLRKLAKTHGFKGVLYALARVAHRKRGKEKAQWSFLAYELREVAHDEVPE